VVDMRNDAEISCLLHIHFEIVAKITQIFVLLHDYEKLQNNG
jgi:hypothetical protein